MKRPAGITIIAVLAFAAGVINLLQGLRILGFVVFGAGQAFSETSITGWLTLIVGVVWIIVGAAFWRVDLWAWLFGVVVAGVSLVIAFLGNMSGWQLGDMLTAMIVPLVILFYLNSHKVKEAFQMEG